MNRSLTILALWACGFVASAQELPVGTLSQNVEFASLGGGLTNTQLADYAGGIVVLYYYTPW